MMILPDLLFWLFTVLLSLYPVSKLVKYRDIRKCMNWSEKQPEGMMEEVKRKFDNTRNQIVNLIKKWISIMITAEK